MKYSTLKVRFQEPVCFIQIDRPEARNTINGQLVAEYQQVLSSCAQRVSVVVLSGNAEFFCFGADFGAIANREQAGTADDAVASQLYDCWLSMLTQPYIVISHVRGKVNAGGIGFLAASDIVLADETAQFSLSELLFGLYPACVLPFLIRRIGFQRAHYLTLTTKPIAVQEACRWGLVDAFESPSDMLLHRHLLRLRRLSGSAVGKYKSYMNGLATSLQELRPQAVAANREFFCDRGNLAAIARFVDDGTLPWQQP